MACSCYQNPVSWGVWILHYCTLSWFWIPEYLSGRYLGLMDASKKGYLTALFSQKLITLFKKCHYICLLICLFVYLQLLATPLLPWKASVCLFYRYSETLIKSLLHLLFIACIKKCLKYLSKKPHIFQLSSLTWLFSEPSKWRSYERTVS